LLESLVAKSCKCALLLVAHTADGEVALDRPATLNDEVKGKALGQAARFESGSRARELRKLDLSLGRG
jgi:hypothetical protein